MSRVRDRWRRPVVASFVLASALAANDVAIMNRYVNAWGTPGSGSVKRCGGSTKSCDWVREFGPVDVGCAFDVGNLGLVSKGESFPKAPKLSFRFADGARFEVAHGDDEAKKRFRRRPVLCEYVPRGGPKNASADGGEVALLMVSNSAGYLFRLWPLFLNKLLYATDVGLRPFLWIGELPPALQRAAAPACLASKDALPTTPICEGAKTWFYGSNRKKNCAYVARRPEQRCPRIGAAAACAVCGKCTPRRRRLKSFYDGAVADDWFSVAAVGHISNHYIKMPATIATLRDPTVRSVFFVDLDAITPWPWRKPAATMTKIPDGAPDVVFGITNHLALSWQVHGSRFAVRSSAFALDFFARWMANRCSFKDQYSLWHTILQVAADAGCVDYRGELWRNYGYWGAKHVSLEKARGDYHDSMYLDCDTIRDKCPAFGYGTTLCPRGPEDVEPHIIDTIVHHTIDEGEDDALRTFTYRTSKGDKVHFEVENAVFPDGRSTGSNRDYLQDLGILDRDPRVHPWLG